jgi:site-specific recombinase XerD
MNTTLSILFYAKKSKATTEGLIPIYLRVTINGQRFEVSTKRYVEESKWNSKLGKVKTNINTEEAKSLNIFIDSLRNRVYQLQREIVQENLSFNIETFKNKWLGIYEKSRMILEIFQHHNDQLRELTLSGEYSLATLERFKTSLQHTQNFIEYKYNVHDLDIKKLDFEFITDYEYWLKTVRKCNHNTTMKYLGNFKKIVILCRKKGWIREDPFYGFRMTKKEVIRGILTEEEVKTIELKKFASQRLSQVRDIFLFSCYTGLAYSEVRNLKELHINIGIDGRRWIFIHRQKTKKLSRIPLLEIPEQILAQYKDHPVVTNKDHLLPILSNQKMNSYLKEIADVCGIQKNLTFHIARHTFATTVTLNNGITIEAVSYMLGHSSLKQTHHYAKVKEKMVSLEMQKLRSKQNNSSKLIQIQKTGS